VTQADSVTLEKERAQKIFNAISIKAKGVIVEEYPSGKVLFAKDERAVYPLASIAKLMTALALQDVEERKTSPFPLVVSITEAAVREEGDNGLLVGEKFYFDDLMDIMLVQSSNDAAHALAAFAGSMFYQGEIDEDASLSVFLQYMNTKKEELGLSDLGFLNVTGLDIDEENKEPGAWGSAASIARLLRILITQHPFMLERTQRDSITISSSDMAHTFQNSNTSAAFLPGLRASKTGYTDAAGGNLAVAMDVGFGRTIIIVVLGSSFDGRFSDVESLYQGALEYYRE